MACYKPLHGYRAISGGITFNVMEGYRDTQVPIACGQCIGCRIDRSKMWAARIVHESQLHTQNAFLTLTYRDENLPSNGSLNKRHVQLFMKKLRRYLGKKKIRFFLCGEYGDNFGRPHYHVVLFGHWFDDTRQTPKKTKTGQPVYVSDQLDRIWSHGHCEIGVVNADSAAYAARYIMKKVNGKRAESHYMKLDTETGELTPVIPEFILMSRGGKMKGIGHDWFQRYHAEVFPTDTVILKGKESQVPKYYDKQLRKINPDLYEAVKQSRRLNPLSDEDRKRYKNSTRKRLAVREEVTKARSTLYKRNL